MNEREDNKELIQRIADALRNHIEPYQEGAWERFAARTKPARRVLWWPYWSTAAVLLIAVGLFWYNRQPAVQGVPPRVVQQHDERKDMAPPAPAGQGQDAVVGGGTAGSIRMLAHTPDGPRTPVAEAKRQPLRLAYTAVEQSAPLYDTVASHLSKDIDLLVAAGTADTVPIPAPDPTPQRVATAVDMSDMWGERAIDQAYVAPPRTAESGLGRWDVGVVVSPSVTSEKINMGGGLAVAYRVSDKLSVGSGISVSQLGLRENPGHQPRYNDPRQQMSPVQGSGGFNGYSKEAIDYRKEVSVTSSVVTLDIPVDLRYEVAKGFYTAVGVSYVAVLNEQRTSHFVDQLNKKTIESGHLPNTDRVVATEFTYSSEKIAAQPLRGNEYAGFMNFSIGKRLPISRKLSLSIEPYFKLPIGRLSREEMDFTNGGIRIVTGF